MSLSFQKLTFQREQKKSSGLNLVALMDIFTVLVFFLLFNVHSEQAIQMSDKLASLPSSTQAMDRLTMKSTFDVLTLPSNKAAYFNGRKVLLGDDLTVLSSTISAYCQAKKEGRCHLLAIEAPPQMPYSYVDKFVALGRRLNFENVYLVVTQAKGGE